MLGSYSIIVAAASQQKVGTANERHWTQIASTIEERVIIARYESAELYQAPMTSTLSHAGMLLIKRSFFGCTRVGANGA